MTIWRMHIERWTNKAKDKHPEYVTLTAFLLQNWATQTRLNITFIIHCLSFSQSYKKLHDFQQNLLNIKFMFKIRRNSVRLHSTYSFTP
jgi:hypothetical protein